MTDSSGEILQSMAQAVIDGEAERVRELARRALEQGIEPMRAINEGLIPGISEVGRRFERKEYFLPELMMAADAMKKGMEVLEAALTAGGGKRESQGTVVLGTVKGDIHDIGKSIVGTLLSAHGFNVIDLGVDVSADRFIENIVNNNADVLGMSALLPTTMPYMKRVVDELVSRGLRQRVKVIVGGAPVTPEYARQIGADAYGDDAISAVHVVQQLLGLAN
jgi:5-methyltetrahydrofolate--homocysteine methyltransferase